MPLTCRSLILGARDAHPSFDRFRHPDAVLVRALSGEQRRLAGKVIQANRSALAAELPPIELAAYDFAAGAALPAFQFVHGAHGLTPTGQPVEVREIAWGNRLRPPSWGFTFYVHAGRLFLTGAPADWKPVASVHVSYAPLPGELASLDAALVLPDGAEACLRAFLADFMARRTPADVAALSPADRARVAAEWSEAEADFHLEVRQGFKATVIRPQRAR